MQGIEPILENNRSWAETKRAEDPDFFNCLADGQAPQYLFIGCSDSRVPASAITGTGPGEMFVHRNIANLAKTSIIQNARRGATPPRLHGLVYDSKEGLLKDLKVEDNLIAELEHIYGTQAMKHAAAVLEEEVGQEITKDLPPLTDSPWKKPAAGGKAHDAALRKAS